MAKINVKHSSIHIHNYKLGDCPRLEGYFSYYDSMYHSSFFKGIEYDQENNKLILPRGMDIFLLEKLFQDKPMLDTRHDPMDYLGTMHLKYMPRDDVQKRAISFMCGEREYHDNKAKSQLHVNLNTGKGKTYCSIATSCYFGFRSMIITSSTDWLEQWRDCILEYTDCQPDEIYMIVGSPSIHRLLKRDMSKIKFILASHDTIKSYGDKNGWDKVSELFKYTKIGIKYYDEAHLNFDNMVKIDAYTNTCRTFYVTATPARSDKDENLIYQYYFKNVPSIDLFDEDNDPHTAYIAMHYNSHPTAMDISNCRNPYGFDKNKYSGYITGKDNYYNMLRILINIALKNGQKNVFYIATNEAIEITRTWIVENYPELADDIGVFTSVISKEQKAKELEKKIILSTTKSLGAAMDIKGLKMVVVLAEPFKSEVIARQTLGRTRDSETFYIEIVDDGFDSIKKYAKSKRPIFEKYAESVSTIKMNDQTIQIKVEKIMREREDKLATLNKLIHAVTFVKPMVKAISFNTYDDNHLTEAVTFIA